MVSAARLAALVMLAGLSGGSVTPSSALAQAARAEAPAADRWAGLIAEAAARFGVPEAWIRAVIWAESRGRTHDAAGRPIVSRAGARGLMQVMPATYAELARRHGLGPDPDDPRDNILAGTAYLRAMHDRFGSPGFLAAYNAGPARYAEHLASGRPLPRETRAYLASVSARLGLAAPTMLARAAPAETAPPEALFAASGTPDDRLFFPLRRDQRVRDEREQKD
jgi:soluble lytic murein transglycosylase-like protein